MFKSIVKLITGGTGVAEKILEKSNTKSSRKYLDEWNEAKKEALEAERQVELEKAKPQEDQLDNVIEHFEKKALHLYNLAGVLEDTADKELERLLAN